MRTLRWNGICALLALLACQPQTKIQDATSGREVNAPRRFSVPSEMGRLIPPDALGLLVVTSIDDYMANALEIIEVTGAEISKDELDLAELIASTLGISPGAIDRTRPLGLALNLPEASPTSPLPTFILPTSDPQSLLEELPTALAEGGYVGVAAVPGYLRQAGTPTIGIDLPAATLALRVDVQGVIERAGTDLDAYLEAELAGLQENDVARQALQWLVGILRSSDRLDLDLVFENGELHFGYDLERAPGSPPLLVSRAQAEDLTDLLQALPHSYPFLSLVAMDSDKLAGFYELLQNHALQQTAGDSGSQTQEAYAGLMRISVELYRQINHQMLAAAGFGEQGIETISIIRAKDGEACLERMRGLLENPMLPLIGVELEPPVLEQYEGFPVHTYRMRFDFDRLAALGQSSQPDSSLSPEEMGEYMRLLFGSEALIIRLAAVDDLVLQVLGQDAAAIEQSLRNLSGKKGALPVALPMITEEKDSDLCFWLETDLRDILLPAFELSLDELGGALFKGTLERLRAAESVPMRLTTSVGAQRYHGRFSLHVGGLMTMVDILQKFPTLTAEAESDKEIVVVSSMSETEATQLADELRPVVEELRGLEFKRPVPVQVVDDATAREHFKSRMAKFMTEEELRAEQEVATQLGLLPEGVDLVSTFFDVLEEQAGGYYDPDRDTFFILGDMPRSTAPILLVHELTHALDDQYYGIDSLLAQFKDKDDHQAAVAAVVEGSGTLVMTKYIVREMQSGRMGPELLTEFQQSEAGKAQKLAASPQLVQRSLLSSYVLGQNFLLRGDLSRIAVDLDPEDLDRAFRQPPRSTEQILHPEKYWNQEEMDEPRLLEMPDLSTQLGPGWSLQTSGELGELLVAMLAGAKDLDLGSMSIGFPRSWTNDAATGWGGDEWQLYVNGERSLTTFASVWDLESDAVEFERAIQTTPRRSAWRRGEVVLIAAGDLDALTTDAVESVFSALLSSSISTRR